MIDRVLQLVPDGEIIEAHEAWRRAQASVALMAGMVQVGEQPPESDSGLRMLKGLLLLPRLS